MFKAVLVANRGVAACRVLRTLRHLGIASIAVHSHADRHALHVDLADHSALIDSYLDTGAVLHAALEARADAIHPGYGFLAENADFAQSCIDAGLAFIGPAPAHIRAFGLKHRAREIAREAGVALAPGSGLLPDLDTARREAATIGYPVMLKSTAGGGGIGLLLCRTEAELDAAFDRVAHLATRSFGDGGLFVERYVADGRHVEVQIFGDGHGRVDVLGDRDCSAQRRHQKIIEETPAPDLPSGVRHELHAAARRLGAAVGYANAGTVEFIYDVAAQAAYFLEVNTRLQVEHAVTEAVLGIDLVEWMLRQAAGEAIPPLPRPPAIGHAIEARLYAEDPAHDFRPAAGRLTRAEFPAGVRVDAGVVDGDEISPFYDPMLATLVATGADRPAALRALSNALDATCLEGIETNLDYLRHLLHTGVLAGRVTTATLAALPYQPPRIEVQAPGTQTTVQDWPGRRGLWHVGVPPSGPMDDRSFRLANRAVGNTDGAAGLEMVISGPTLRFVCDTTLCLAGAELPATLDGAAIPYWRPVEVARGSTLVIGSGAPAGSRTYLALRGGIDVPEYLGSQATFTLGGFGGQAGRALLAGDVLRLGRRIIAPPQEVAAQKPEIATAWDIGVLDGPHGAPDFFTDADIAAFYAADWVVHYNSSRTGVRLIGPHPQWARADGGEAGLHPSNIHDTPYAVGAVDFTGDMPVILGPDGPSLGGFVCPVTIAADELWKAGQLRAGDTVRFRRLSEASPLLVKRAATQDTPRVAYRRSGDSNLLIEYGEQVLDLELRVRVHVLMQALQGEELAGIIDLTPGIRSLQVHHDPAILPLDRLLDVLTRLESGLPANDAIVLPSRIVHLPLSWDDPATRQAVERYVRGVRPDAPWCTGGSNLEFIRRINGLDSIDDVKRIVLSAEYLVLGLGDVYLGAPVATPLDPRHRLVTTKYNPARTRTPENAVGIGGAYLCVYGMEGPGGYQFVGRTCQVWNSFRSTAEFPAGTPWLLRFFDRIRFHEVDAATLLDVRDRLPHGRASLRIEDATFTVREHRAFLRAHADGIEAFKRRQQGAFEAERARWAAAGYEVGETEPRTPESAAQLTSGQSPVTSPVAGGVWKLLVKIGDTVEAGQQLLVLEAMKAEIGVKAPKSGVVAAIWCDEGTVVTMGQILIALA